METTKESLSNLTDAELYGLLWVSDMLKKKDYDEMIKEIKERNLENTFYDNMLKDS